LLLLGNYSIKSPSALDFFDEAEVADESPKPVTEPEDPPKMAEQASASPRAGAGLSPDPSASPRPGGKPDTEPEPPSLIAAVLLPEPGVPFDAMKQVPDLIASDPLADPLALPEVKDEAAANDGAGYEADDEGTNRADADLMPPPPTPALTDAQLEEQLKARKLETPLAAMLPSKYADISVTRLFPDFRVDKVCFNLVLFARLY